MPTLRPRTTLALTVALAASAVPFAAQAAVPGQAAPAATPPPLNVTYDAVGTSHIGTVNADAQLGPTNLKVSVNSADGSFTGHLPIPQTTTSFNVGGLLPTTAKVDFIEAAPVSGKLNRVGNTTTVTSTAQYYIKLSDVSLAGLPASVGDKCQTAQPVSVPANTPAGGSFNITSGGPLEGTFTIGQFENCGLATTLINGLVPGPNNTDKLTVSNGRLG